MICKMFWKHSPKVAHPSSAVSLTPTSGVVSSAHLPLFKLPDWYLYAISLFTWILPYHCLYIFCIKLLNSNLAHWHSFSQYVIPGINALDNMRWDGGSC